jgi:phosphoglycolate phosphatase
MLLQAMAETGAAPRETVMIGDTSYDMIMARDAGALPLGVAWGYHTPEELAEAGAVAVARDYPHLLALLASGNGEAAA